MTEDDDVSASGRSEALCTRRIMRERDAHPVAVEGSLPRDTRQIGCAVHVPEHNGHGRDAGELHEDLRGADVARMEDPLHACEDLMHPRGHMTVRIREHADTHGITARGRA